MRATSPPPRNHQGPLRPRTPRFPTLTRRPNLPTLRSRPFQPDLSLFLFLKQKPRHFDRSRSQSHRERRSGEICFSPSGLSRPLSRRCLLLVILMTCRMEKPRIYLCSNRLANLTNVLHHGGLAKKRLPGQTPEVQTYPPCFEDFAHFCRGWGCAHPASKSLVKHAKLSRLRIPRAPQICTEVVHVRPLKMGNN